MPLTIQWYVRTALAYLLVSSALGVAYQIELWRPVFGLTSYTIVVHSHLALMGGVVQMIMGVGLWMFPLTVPIEHRMQFKPALAWATYLLFNGGLLGRFVAEGLFRTHGGDVLGALTVLTGFMQFAAMIIFVFHLWSLRPARRTARKS